MPGNKRKTVFDHTAYVLGIIAAIFILLGFLEGALTVDKFFAFRKYIVFIAAIFIATVAYHNKKEWYLWPFLAIAILFNPFFSIRNITQEALRVIDVLAALAFIFLK